MNFLEVFEKDVLPNLDLEDKPPIIEEIKTIENPIKGSEEPEAPQFDEAAFLEKITNRVLETLSKIEEKQEEQGDNGDSGNS